MKEDTLSFLGSIFPFSYRLWKKSNDKVYYKIKPEWRREWMSLQNSIYSGSMIPILTIVFGFFIVMSIDFTNLLGITNPEQIKKIYYTAIFVFLVLIYDSLIRIRWIDKYIDEKYIELSIKENGENGD